MSKGVFNQRVSAISPSLSLAITSKAKAMAAAGENVCSFAAGETDFDTPEHIKRAAAEALAAGETKYTPAVGLPALRAAVAEKLSRENGLSYEPTQITINCGAKHSLYNVFMALIVEGDDVIVPAPYWLSYPEMVAVSGGHTVAVHTTEASGFKISAEQFREAITPRTKAIVLNSPSNPTGTVYAEAELRELAAIAVEHGIYIISDEIYEKILYDGLSHVSPASFSSEVAELTITVNGFSKAFSMTGWRLGYVAGPEALIRAISALQSHSTSGPNTFAQYGALAALAGGDACIKEMVSAFDERRHFLHGRLTEINGVSCPKPQGAFYMFPNISRFGLDSMAFAERLLAEQKVACIPGIAFGSPENVRFSYATSMAVLEEGMKRFETFVTGL